VTDGAIGSVVGSLIGYFFARKSDQKPTGRVLKGAYIGGIVGAAYGRTMDSRNKGGYRPEKWKGSTDYIY
jgi:Glycine zipper